MIAMLPFGLAWPLLCVATGRCFVYSYPREDTVYGLMDFNDQHTKETYVQLPIEIII